jgi:hypothetical protein
LNRTSPRRDERSEPGTSATAARDVGEALRVENAELRRRATALETALGWTAAPSIIEGHFGDVAAAAADAADEALVEVKTTVRADAAARVEMSLGELECARQARA